MNRFRTKKRAKETVEGGGRSSSDPDGSTFPSFSSKSIRRGKKAQAELRPELDLSTALPSSDNFRTSLLMPNLSARFSMLREQDDPTSKIGKANDDSVLFPKRASRLNLFSHPGLSDIAETAPFDSIRRPFASERADSYHSSEGYGTDDDSSHSGSVMGRPKHREGNNLFGGRQKIYKIPVGGSALAKNLGSTSVDAAHGSGGRMGGRALYDDDVSTASFRNLEKKGSEVYGRPAEGELVRKVEDDAPTDDRSASPPPAGYNRNRETSSSTASAPSNIRTSTAATSITSQSVVSLPGASGYSTSSPPPSQHSPTNPAGPVGPERAPTRSRRLYGQGLDQQMHDRQNSALHKLDSLQQRQPVAVTPQHLLQSQSAFNLRDHYQRAGSPYALPGNHEVSPPPPSVPASPSKAAFGIVDNGPVSPPADRFPISRGPASTESDEGSVFSSAVQPNDRGKATALGAFNKPSMPYDEQQYSRRQFQLQQARDLSPVERISSPATEDERHHAPRGRDGSDASSQSRSVASSRYRDGSRSSPTTYHAREIVAAAEEHPNVDLEPTSNGTFFAQSSESDDRSESGSETEEDQPVTKFQPQNPFKVEEKSQPDQVEYDADQHPAYNPYSPQPLYKDFTQEDSPGRSSTASRMHARNESLQGKALSDIIDADSPTLGPASGLNGLVRAHLRNDSGQSSIYAAPSPVLGPRPTPGRSSSEPVASTLVPSGLVQDVHDSAVGDAYNGDTSDRSDLSLDIRDESWELDKHIDDSSGQSHPIPAQPEATAAPPLSLRAKQILDQAAALRDRERLRVQQAANEGASAHGEARTQQETEPERSWQGLHESRHQRTESTETEKERQDFATELSNRRKRVQEKLKDFAEDEGNSGSPTSGRGSAIHSPTKYANAFGPSKSSPNKGSMAGRQDSSIKAMKMLGISGSSASDPHQRDHSQEEEQRMRRDPGMRPTGRSVPASSRTDYHNGPPPVQGFRQRQASDEGYKGSPHRGPSPPSASTSQDQLNSARLGEHSRRGNGKNQDNIDIGNAVGARGFSNAPYGETSRFGNTSNYQRRSPDAPEDQNTRTRSPSAVSGRGLSSTHATATHPFGSKSPLSLQTHNQPSTEFEQRPYHGTLNASSRRPTIDGNSPTMSVPIPSAMPPSNGFHTSGRIPNNRKKSVSKSQISDPTFLSGTSSVNTRDLPITEGVGPRGDAPSRGLVPPLPPINPRRKTAQQTIASVFGRSETSPTSRTGEPTEQGHSVVSNRKVEARPHVRQRLRKSSSEGGNLGVRARQHALMSPSPTVPQGSQRNGDMF